MKFAVRKSMKYCALHQRTKDVGKVAEGTFEAPASLVLRDETLHIWDISLKIYSPPVKTRCVAVTSFESYQNRLVLFFESRLYISATGLLTMSSSIS